MARILFTWELGGAMGHLALCRPLAEELARRGHELYFASAHVSAVERMLRGVAFTLAPALAWPAPARHPSRVHTYAHVLRGVGYGDVNLLARQLRAWCSIIDTAKPQLLVANASPTALLAARARDTPAVMVGTGFDSPTGTYPLTGMRFWESTDASRWCADEDALLASINASLQSVSAPALARLSELFRLPFTGLCTVAELDHYRDRGATNYYAPLSLLPGIEVPWPAGQGARVFAYLKPFPEVGKLLFELQRRKLPTLVYAPDVPRDIIARHVSDTIHFAENALDVKYAAAHCDLNISNAGPALVLDMLLAGKPVLCFPLYLEQYIVARNVAATGAGAYCSPWRTNRIGPVLEALIHSPSYVTAARRFAAKYAHLDRAVQTEKLTDQLEAVLR